MRSPVRMSRSGAGYILHVGRTEQAAPPEPRVIPYVSRAHAEAIPGAVRSVVENPDDPDAVGFDFGDGGLPAIWAVDTSDGRPLPAPYIVPPVLAAF